MLANVAMKFFCFLKGSVKEHFGSRNRFRGCSRRIVLFELVMYELERVGASFLDLSIELPTIGTFACLFTLGIDLFAYLCPPQIINVWPPQVSEERLTLFFREQNPGAILVQLESASR